MRQVLGAGALGRPRGMGSGGRREGGSGWGTHVNPWLIHVNVWQKPLQYCKVISLQLIKINEKTKNKKLSLGKDEGSVLTFWQKWLIVAAYSFVYLVELRLNSKVVKSHIQRKTWSKMIHAAQCSLQHCLQ